MSNVLKPGYLRWDGTKYTLDPDIEIVGPPGTQGFQGPIGATGPVGATGTIGATGQIGPIGPTGTVGPIGASNPTRLVLVSGIQQVAGTTFKVIGGGSVDMLDYPATYNGLVRTISFIADYHTSDTGDTATIKLWDTTNGVVITGTTDSTSLVNPPRRFISSALTVGASNGNIRNDAVTQYQVQLAVTAGSSINNAVCYDAYLLVKYS